MSEPGGNGLHYPAVEEFIAHVKVALAEDKPVPKPPARKFLGMEVSAWVKMIVGWSVAALVFFTTWYNTVNADLAELEAKPTTSDVQNVVKGDLEEHSLTIHPPAETRLKALEQEQRVIRDSQIRQETIDTQQSEVLREIRDDVKQIRRNR